LIVRIKTIYFPDYRRRATIRIEEAHMDTSEYVLGLLAADKLASARAEAQRRALVARPERTRLRVRLGMTLIALGRRLAHVPAPQRAAL
jgi:hypothetical protein